jgi:hypothetical protein
VRLRPHSDLKPELPPFQKGTDIYYSFLSKALTNESSLGFPKGTLYKDGGLPTGHFAYLSKASSFRFLGEGALPKAPSTEPL